MVHTVFPSPLPTHILMKFLLPQDQTTPWNQTLTGSLATARDTNCVILDKLLDLSIYLFCSFREVFYKKICQSAMW